MGIRRQSQRLLPLLVWAGAAVAAPPVPAPAAAAPSSCEQLAAEGQRLLSKRHWAEAVSVLEKAVVLCPDRAPLRLSLAQACDAYARECAEEKDWPKALTLTRRARTLAPDDAGYRVRLAALLLRYASVLAGGKADTAVVWALVEEAWRVHPDDPQTIGQFTAVTVAHGLGLIKSGRQQQAIPILRQGLRAHPRSAVLHEVLGMALEAVNDLPAAVQEWETAKSLGSLNPDLEAKIARSSRAAVAEKDFAARQREHFLLKYQGDTRREDAAQVVAEILEEVYRDVGRTYQRWPERQLPVILYGSDQYQYVTGASEWSVGQYDGSIRVRLPAGPPDAAKLRSTLYHEYTHAMLFDLYGSRLPRWVHEGLASTSQPDQPPPALELKVWNAMDRRRLRPPWELEDSFDSQEPKDVSFAYLSAAFFFRFLKDRYQSTVIMAFLGEFGDRKKTMDDITVKLFNLTAQRLFENWLESDFAPKGGREP